MNIKIHSIHFDADSKLLNFIDMKVKKLLQFFDDIIGAEVFLRLEKVQDMEMMSLQKNKANPLKNPLMNV
jgi:putative sigma-54 modulation protein